MSRKRVLSPTPRTSSMRGIVCWVSRLNEASYWPAAPSQRSCSHSLNSSAMSIFRPFLHDDQQILASRPRGELGGPFEVAAAAIGRYQAHLHDVPFQMIDADQQVPLQIHVDRF